MHNADIRPVYKHKNIPHAFDNALYFYAKYTSNCPICISYHEEPCIIPCGHIFCAQCLDRLSSFSRCCPVCTAGIWSSRPVRLYIAQGLSDTITFIRLTTSYVLSDSTCSFFECPYRYSYYEDQSEAEPGAYTAPVHTLPDKSPCGAVATHTFYQNVDGQLHFLNPKCTRHLKALPEYIYGKVKSIYTCKSQSCSYAELRHIPPNYEISVVTIEM
ncbi:hypothetical protein PAPHI01_0834 [Pancytospora philotis]|nr:hypothetical protein PAPHI01_0834 [Pancytospora philotis]